MPSGHNRRTRLSTIAFLVAFGLCRLQWGYLQRAVSSLYVDDERGWGPRSSLSDTHSSPAKYILRPGPHIGNIGTQVQFKALLGLGHRLSKLSCAFHLAQYVWKGKVSFFHARFRNCVGVEVDIFEDLFGAAKIQLARPEPPTMTRLKHMNTTESRILQIQNDVLGYYSGENYKRAQIKIPHSYTDASRSPWLQKMESDVLLFNYLIRNFRGLSAMREFQAAHGFTNHTVIGLHLRVGNGEGQHFIGANRSVTNATIYIKDTVDLIRRFLEANPPPKPPLLFVATDQVTVLPVLRHHMSDIPIATYSQPRVPEQKGVSFKAWRKGSQCLDGWYYSFMDMALLSEADVVVAGMFSTFTQILPLARVFGKQIQPHRQRYDWKYCEVGGERQTRLSCFRTREDWLFRLDPSRIQTVGLMDPVRAGKLEPVQHSVVVHLPELEREPQLDAALAFLVGDKPGIWTLGEPFNPKFREFNQSTLNLDWSWRDL